MNSQHLHYSNMNPLKTIKATAQHQRSKGYPMRELEDAIVELDILLKERQHLEQMLYKMALFFTKADCHPLYYNIVRKESVEYIERHEFFGDDLRHFRDMFNAWKRPLE